MYKRRKGNDMLDGGGWCLNYSAAFYFWIGQLEGSDEGKNQRIQALENKIQGLERINVKFEILQKKVLQLEEINRWLP